MKGRLGMLARNRIDGAGGPQAQPQGIGGPVGDWVEEHWGFNPGKIPHEDQEFGFDLPPGVGNPAAMEPEPYTRPFTNPLRREYGKQYGRPAIRDAFNRAKAEGVTFTDQPAGSLTASGGWTNPVPVVSANVGGLTQTFNPARRRGQRMLGRLHRIDERARASEDYGPERPAGLGELARARGGR